MERKETMEKTNETMAAMTQVRHMAVGDVLEFPLKRLLSVRSNVGSYSVALGRQYSTRSDRERGVVVVRRLA